MAQARAQARAQVKAQPMKWSNVINVNTRGPHHLKVRIH